MDLVLLPIADHRREEQKTAVSILILMDLVLLHLIVKANTALNKKFQSLF